MKYAIVESGGKQFKAVEGEVLDVDRLPGELGEEFDMQRVLLFVDGDSVSVGQPTVAGIQVLASIMKHFRGDKVLAFRYSPKKRIRVHRGARHDYTRLMVEHVGAPGGKKAKVAKKPVEAVAPSEGGQEADDLVKIEGVGPKAAKALIAAGVTTFDALAKSSVEDIQTILTDANLKMNPETWMEQAALAAKGDWKAFDK